MENMKSAILALLAVCSCGYAGAWEYGGEPQGLPYEDGLGTQEAPYIIKTAQQLANLAYSVNSGQKFTGSYFKLANDIDLNPGVTFDPDNEASYSAAAAWTPIGAESDFCGNFDGDGHTVKGLYLKGDNVKQVYSTNYIVEGLFGNIKDMTLSNLTITNSLIVYTPDENVSSDYTAGFFAAQSDNCNFINLRNEGNVRTYYTSGENYDINASIAGIVATANVKAYYHGTYNEIKGCENYGTMKMTAPAAGSLSTTTSNRGFCGIIGEGSEIAMSDCHNYGDLDGMSILYCYGIGYMARAPYEPTTVYDNLSNAGDINGGAGLFNFATAHALTNSCNTGDITNGCGLMNDCQFSRLEGCYNTGNVNDELGKGVNGTGGLIGYTDYLTEISKCYNTGKISSCQSAGGIIGCAGPYDVAITGCTNEGTVEGPYYAGGIVGDAFGSNLVFDNCHNKATVTGGYGCGGIFGYSERNNVRLTDCTNDSDITGKYSVGGLVGEANEVNILDSSNSGDISATTDSYGNSYAGGLAGNARATYPDQFFERSSNSGDVTATGKYAGGIAGHSSCLVQCYNTGNVTGASHVGGLSGNTSAHESAPFLNCYNTGAVKGEDFVAGLCSEIHGAAKYCFNYGTLECGTDNKALLWIYEYMMFEGETSSSCYALPQDGWEVARINIGAGNTMTKQDGCETRTKDEFAGGSVCLLLNAGQDPTPWGQEPGTDAYPLLNGKGNPDVGGIEAVDAPQNAFSRIFTLDGRTIKTEAGKIPANLPAGIYIVNGKKMILK